MGQEAREELEELQWQLDHLDERLAALPASAGRPVPDLACLARADIAELRAHSEALAAAPEGLLVQQQDRLRRLYRLIAMLESADDWHSSPASLGHPITDLAPLTVVAGYNDYQRGYLAWARQHEDRLGAASLGALASPGRTLLFSSGMGAIQTVLQLLLGRLDRGARLLLGRRVYYETQELLLRTLGEDSVRVSPLDEREQDVDALAARLRAADILFVDTCTLDSDAVIFDFRLLQQALARVGRTELAIVADNTVMGPAGNTLMPMGASSLFVVESALKHYQAGLDLTAAGLLHIVASGHAEREAELLRSLETLRGTNGTNIHPYAVRLLPLLPRRLLLQRLQRQNRNAAMLAAGIETCCPVRCTGQGGLLFLDHLRAAELVELVLLLALARRQRLVRGTSFGFNTTRVSLSPTSPTSVRFACGMERWPVMEQLVDIVRTALVALAAPEVAALCVRLARLFPEYPESLVPSVTSITALEEHLRRLDAAASAVAARAAR